MGRLTGIVIAALVAAALGGCGDDSTDATVSQVEIDTTVECAYVGNVTAIRVSQGMTCDEAHKIARQWTASCDDPSQGCAFGDGNLACFSEAKGETSLVKCTDSEAGEVRFAVVPRATFGGYPTPHDS